MNFLAENAIVIWMAGAVLVTMCGIVYVQTRAGKALVAMLIAVLATGSLLVAERLLETPREAVVRSLEELADAIEANDLPEVLTYIAPNAKLVRSDAETLMPMVKVNKANIVGTPEVTLDLATQPPTATAVAQGFIDAVLKKNGMKGGYLDRVTIDFVLDGDRWLIEDYRADRNWHRAAGGRPK
jgi:hypothetical protein